MCLPGRRNRARIATAAVAVSLLSIFGPGAFQPAGAIDPVHVGVRLSKVAGGLHSPVGVAAPNDGSGRLFILEQAGRIRVWTPRSGLLGANYMDISARVLDGGERGLLGLAFHPNFKSNGYFYVYYTNNSGNLQISRFHATPGSNTASPLTEYSIMTISHPTYANHNGGELQFWGGYLYIGTGDGGGGGDPSGNAQNLKSLLGKILRIDVDHQCGSLHYCNPTSNPFYGKSYSKYEVWLWGLRNPWRFSFERGVGILWIGDVGQATREEVDALSPGIAGRNMGWDCYEGTLNTVSLYGGSYCAGRTFTPPIYNYTHVNGRCAITGGYVYMGAAQYSVMGGLYLFADYCTGEIWGLARTGGAWKVALAGKDSSSITSFGEGPTGEVYVVDTGGSLWRVVGYRR
jgi:glucose/arabinose dehydrogenase